MNHLIESGAVDPRAYEDLTGWLCPRWEEDAKAFLLEVATVLKTRGSCSKQLAEMADCGKLREIVDFEIPLDLELDDYRASRQIQALFNKQCWINLGYDPLLEGVKAFIKAEQRCIETNIRFEMFGGSSSVRHVFNMARDRLSTLLGEVPSLEELRVRFGPGANTSTKMAEASLSGKLSAKLACSEDLLPYVGDFLAEVPHVAAHHSEKSHVLLPLYTGDPDKVIHRVTIGVDDGKLVFVPKSAKTHRPIVVEPIINGLFQLGVGSYLKDRLAAYGLNLRDQERNRKLARKGSIDGSLATIDLSSASDTLSWGLVADMLPSGWLDLLAKLRTGTFTYDGKAYSLEKFSSMGNGYTFELESAVFYCIAWACVSSVSGDVSSIGVFGDDIIVPSEATPILFEVLDHCGFWVNNSKSFWSGPFRESCGADWLLGEDVRPFYIRDEISDKTLYCFHNWAMRRGERELASLCESWTWEQNRLYGPDGFGDGHLLGSHDLYSSRLSRRSGWEGGYFDTYSLRPKRHQKRRSGDWIVPTYSVYARTGAESPTDPYIVRGSEGYVRTPLYTLSTTIFCG
jgi:hypothetical protein